MDITTFSRILRAFADTAADIDLDRGRLLVHVRDEVIEAGLSMRAGELMIQEGGDHVSAGSWIINRIARMNLLAERLLNHIDVGTTFIPPSGTFLARLDQSAGGIEVQVPDATKALKEALNGKLAGFTSAIYLTSDAGEGKTTIIGTLARQQAEAYKRKETDWLLVPIPLGGRAFLQFDDVVIAALVNRYRFTFFYFDAFIELVKLGVLVPAFDGFEEMFIETSSGEALSALGNLVQALDSSGSIVIAARKAYFEYQSFRTQAKLFDSVGKYDVSFSRIGLNRWGREQFVKFSASRSLPDPDHLYLALVSRLGERHPLLSRAVLATRLIEEAIESPSVDDLVVKLGETQQDYFHAFVSTIVEREAREKWTDKSGEPFKPLLSVDEHHELLSMVSLEMWNTGVEALRLEILDLVSDMFVEHKKMTAAVARQVKERLKQHALITLTVSPRGLYTFDHEDFRKFYLGEALGRTLLGTNMNDVHSLLRVNPLPAIAIEQACAQVVRSGTDLAPILAAVQRLADSELLTSFVKENCGAITAQIISSGSVGGAQVAKMVMVLNALAGRRFDGATFTGCYFQPTNTADARVRDCVFTKCEFERIELDPSAQLAAVFVDCEVRSLVVVDEDRQLFNPAEIASVLEKHGIAMQSTGQKPLALERSDTDEELTVLERALRPFLRSTQVNEEVFKLRLGARAHLFFEDVLPALIRREIIEEVKYRGGGAQRRFRLCVPMTAIQAAFTTSQGSFERFLAEIE